MSPADGMTRFVIKVKLLQYANNLKIITYLYTSSDLLEVFVGWKPIIFTTEVSDVAVIPSCYLK